MISESLSRPDRPRRIRFAIFVKVLLKLIDEKLVRDQAKTILHSCIKQNRLGQSKYASLMDAIELPLRGLVGDSIWLCAYHYTELYHNKGRFHKALEQNIKSDDPTPWSEPSKEFYPPSPYVEFSDTDDCNPTPWSELSKRAPLYWEETLLQA